jgi:hypothetical protein
MPLLLGGLEQHDAMAVRIFDERRRMALKPIRF